MWHENYLTVLHQVPCWVLPICQALCQILGKHRAPTANTHLCMRQPLSLPGLQSPAQVLEP